MLPLWGVGGVCQRRVRIKTDANAYRHSIPFFLANPNNNVLVLKKQCINISMLGAASMPCLWALGVLKSRFSSFCLHFFEIWFFQRIPIKMGVLNLVHELLHSFGQLSNIQKYISSNGQRNILSNTPRDICSTLNFF